MNDYETLLQIISRTTRYMRTYLGKVVNNEDEDQKGRVLIIIPELGITTDDEGVWADVEQPIAKNVIPSVGSWVSVYFMSGDASKPTVRGIVNSISDNVPQTDEQNRIFYEDESIKISLDMENQILKIDGDIDIEVNGNATIKCKNMMINDHLEILQ